MNAQVEANKEAEIVIALTPEQLEEQAKKQIEADEKELVELGKAVSSNKPVDFIRLAKLSTEKAEREKKKEAEVIATKLHDYVVNELKLDIATAISYLKPHLPVVQPAQTTPITIGNKEVLYQWQDAQGKLHQRIDGDKATASWANEMKKAIPHFKDALNLIVATTERNKSKAKSHLEKVYAMS